MLSSNQLLNQGRYRIIDQLGSLDSNRLYEAYDTVSNSKVVLSETVGQLGKVATAAQIENFKAAFAADAKRLAEVDHPSLLKITDFFSEIDRQYLVMETCEGSDLATLISSQEKGPGVADVLRWADQMLDGLHYLHVQNPGILHQHVSPQNTRLTSNFKIKLLVSNGNGVNGGGDPDIESTEDASQAYKSLEQLWLGLDSASQKMIANSFGAQSEEILRQPLDARADIYSVGATLYFLLTRTEPVDALARYLEMLDGNDDPLRNPVEINSSISDDFSQILMKAMELKRENRFETAAEMRTELARIKLPNRMAEVRATAPAPSAVPPSEPDTKREEEIRRVEKERLELEAEQNRLKEEKANIERRRLELEAERQKQAELFEAKRLVEERQKAEKLEAERAAAVEMLRAERAAADERARADVSERARQQAIRVEAPKSSLPAKPEVEKLQMELAKDDLLDLPDPEFGKVIGENVSTDVFALDVEHPVARKPAQIDTSFDLYPSHASRPGLFSRPPVLVGLASVILVVIIGIWMFSGSGNSSTSPAASIQTAPGTIDGKQPPQSGEVPTADSNSNFVPQGDQSAANSAGPSSVTGTKGEHDGKEKVHKQPQVKPTPEKKKTVTVDDLINDN